MLLRFHRKIYSKKALDKAIEAFREAADFEVSRQGEYWTVKVEPASDEIGRDEVAGEFENYVFGLTYEERWKE